MKRYKPLFEYSYNKLEEDFHLFSVVKNKKVFVKSFMDMCKHYNKFYKMINPKIMSNGHAVNCRVLLWDNNVANFDFDILDNGQVFIDFAKVPNNVVNFKTGQVLTWKVFFEQMKKLLDTCYVRIFHSPYNDVEARDYTKIRIF